MLLSVLTTMFFKVTYNGAATWRCGGLRKPKVSGYN